MLRLTDEEKLELIELLTEKEKRRVQRKIDSFFCETGPNNRELYPKIMDFFKAGKDHKFRLLMAGNRVGKTLAAAFEITCHVTGSYPDWWEGRRYAFPQNWWVAGVDSKIILSVLQPMFLGTVNDFGTGMIPHDCLDFDTIKDARKADTPIGIFRIKHISGGFSSIEFKSYESGRESFQSFNGCIWLDEESPLPIYQECVMRTTHTGGEQPCLLMTFTPLKGVSDTIKNYFEGKSFSETGTIGVSKYVVRASLMTDAPHVPEIERQIILANTPPWARDARLYGIPQHGAGAIYPIPLQDILVKRFEIPKHWKRYAGMDVGNKTAAIWFAISPDNGTHYGYHEYYREGELPSVHTESIAGPGKWVPIAIDHAAHGRSQIDGKNLFDMYTELGLTLHNADKSVEAGLYTCWERLSNGKIKIFNDLKRFQEEYLIYHKDEQGRVVKKDDHLMDAFRYAQMTGVDLATNEQLARPDIGQPKWVSPHYRVQPMIRR